MIEKVELIQPTRDMYLEPYQTSKKKLFVEIVNGLVLNYFREKSRS